MSKRFIGLTVLVVLSLVTVGTLFAQTYDNPVASYRVNDDITLPNLWFTSPTKTATESRFGADADNYIGVGDYAGVEFDNRYMFGAFDGDMGYLGYAQRFGGTYVGLYYGGNLLDGFQAVTKTTREGDDQLNDGVSAVPGWVNATWGASNYYPGNADRVAVIVGLANMGFRLSWASTYQTVKVSDVAYAGDDYAMYEVRRGIMAPQLAWGMSTPLTANGIKPNVTVDFYIHKDNSVYDQYTDYANSNETGGETVDYAFDYMMPKINVGLGGYNFYTGDALTLGADLGYTLAIAMFKSDYNYLDDDADIQTASVKGFNDNGTLTELSWMQHKIAPSVNATYNVMPELVLKANLDLPVAITISKKNAMGLVHDDPTSGDLEQAGNADQSTEIQFAPVISLAMQYKILSDKLFLNVGGIMQPASVTWTTEKRETYTAGEADDDSNTSTKTRVHTGGLAALSLGVTWNITDTIALDAMTGVQRDTWVNTFGLGDNSITAFGSIMASLKF